MSADVLRSAGVRVQGTSGTNVTDFPRRNWIACQATVITHAQ
jgi:hypothetical protein